MPINEYACTVCDHHLETMQKMSDAPLREPPCGAGACPACLTD